MEGVGTKARLVRSSNAPLGAQGVQTQTSICIVVTFQWLIGLRVVSVGEAWLTGFKEQGLLKLNPEV